MNANEYMSFALHLASLGRLTVSPNPMVGCVIVKHNKIIGTGFHQKAGSAHAEVLSLLEAGVEAENASAYITLEPCCHHGKTPPCTDALIKAKIKKVFIACLDPNPLVNGKGIEKLKAAGISVYVGVKEEEAKKLNEIFFHYMLYQRPFVIAKWAMSWDGKTTTHQNDSTQISNALSHQHAHQLRETVDAILIGAKTAIKDDPLLTIRFSDNKAKKQPKRIILTTRSLPLHLRLFHDEWQDHTIIATLEQNSMSYPSPIETLFIPKNKEGQVDLIALLKILAERKITSLLVEGGMTVLNSFFTLNLVNKVHLYLAPVIISHLKEKLPLTNVCIEKLQDDFHLISDI